MIAPSFFSFTAAQGVAPAFKGVIYVGPLEQQQHSVAYPAVVTNVDSDDLLAEANSEDVKRAQAMMPSLSAAMRAEGLI